MESLKLRNHVCIKVEVSTPSEIFRSTKTVPVFSPVISVFELNYNKVVFDDVKLRRNILGILFVILLFLTVFWWLYYWKSEKSRVTRQLSKKIKTPGLHDIPNIFFWDEGSSFKSNEFSSLFKGSFCNLRPKLIFIYTILTVEDEFFFRSGSTGYSPPESFLESRLRTVFFSFSFPLSSYI